MELGAVWSSMFMFPQEYVGVVGGALSLVLGKNKIKVLSHSESSFKA